MKKVLLAGTALVAAALVASPAQAELKLGLGGHFKGYGVYVDEDAEADNQRDFEFRKNTEVHFTGETTLDNGLTVGVHVEQSVENIDDQNNENYAYFSGGWGRVNFGNEDGAAYLLQIAAPSADSNVDGLRTYIRGFQSDVELDYDLAHFGNGPIEAANSAGENRTDRITYLTPKFNGFQAGVSYAPEAETNDGLAAMGNDGFEDALELAARWDGQFEGVGISVGAGYSTVDNADVGGGAEPEGWNAGFNLAWNAFSFGAVYLDEQDVVDVDVDTTTWVVGAAWDNGPWHVGASYLAREDEAAGTDVDSYKATVGGGYTFGPGMTFRGALAFGEAPVTTAGVTNEESFTQVTLGTDISF
jgi:outer membrane protein OmpU